MRSQAEHTSRSTVRRALRRLRQVGLGLLGIVSISAAAIALFRTWVYASADENAPTVVLSIGADIVNDVGLHQAAYQAVLASQGARVVEVTPRDLRSAAEILAGADALVLTGGGDVDPALYGGDPKKASLVDPKRDAFETALIREALDRGIPILGVCRGIQIANVALGGTLLDVRADPRIASTHGISARSLVAHSVDVDPKSAVGRASGGASTIQVNSFHGQVVGRLAEGVVVTAAASDGVVEAFEVEGARYAVFVQWHPELMAFVDQPAWDLFADLLREASRHRAERARPTS